MITPTQTPDEFKVETGNKMRKENTRATDLSGALHTQLFDPAHVWAVYHHRAMVSSSEPFSRGVHR